MMENDEIQGEFSVKPLPLSTIKLLGSFQVITSPSTVVKELMENSLDAKATNLQIKLENYGLDSIQISDNGSGVLPSDVACMCRRSCTSKIADFNDLDKLESYGFRGEALNSICAVARVTVTTKTSGEKLARRYTLNHDGEITSCKSIQSDIGTTVLVENLFHNLPVRKQFLSSGKRKIDELKNVENVVKTLAVINHGVRVVLVHNKFVVWQKHGVHSILLSLVQMLSSGLAKQLHEINFDENQMSFKLLVPKKDGDVKDTCYGNSGKSLYLFVNSRPVRVKPIEKVVYEVFNTFFQSAIPTGKLPTCLLSLILPPDAVDVNLEPNKTKILIRNLERVLNTLKEEMERYYFGVLESILNSQEHIEAATKRKPSEDPFVELGAAAKCLKLDETVHSSEKSREAIIAEFVEGLERSETPVDATMKNCENRNEDTNDVKDDLSPEKNSFFNDFFQKMKTLKNKEKLSQPTGEVTDFKGVSKENNVSPEPSKGEERPLFTSSQWSRGEVIFKGRQLPSNVLIGSGVMNESLDADLNQTSTPVPTQERSVSSQMGQKNMCGFTKFAREIRGQLISQTPGITFGKIARELASRWKELKQEEKEMYKEKALEEKELKKKEKQTMPQTVGVIDKHVKPSARIPPVKKRFPIVVSVACTLDKMKSLMNKRVSYAEAPLYEICTLNEDLVIVREKKDIAIFSRARLSEAVKYRNALIHTTVDTKPLKTPVRLDETILGKDLMKTLQSLAVNVDVKFDGDKLITRDLVSDDRLIKNGFIVNRTNDSPDYSIIELPEAVELNVQDLKETLSFISKDDLIGLRECRPKKILDYIERQVLETCSQSQMSSPNYSMDLYKYWSEKVKLKHPECPHARPVRILLHSDS